MTRDEETNERNACDEWWHAQPNKGASIQEAWVERARRAEQDAKRYRRLRDWYLRGGTRSEIHPNGHIERTTSEIIDQAIDAAIAKEQH